MNQCRHGNQQHQCAECTRAMMPAHEAIKAAMKAGVDLFAPEQVDDYLLQVREERDRYRKALEKIAFKTRDWAPTLESCKSIAVEALKG